MREYILPIIVFLKPNAHFLFFPTLSSSQNFSFILQLVFLFLKITASTVLTALLHFSVLIKFFFLFQVASSLTPSASKATAQANANKFTHKILLISFPRLFYPFPFSSSLLPTAIAAVSSQSVSGTLPASSSSLPLSASILAAEPTPIAATTQPSPTLSNTTTPANDESSLLLTPAKSSFVLLLLVFSFPLLYFLGTIRAIYFLLSTFPSTSSPHSSNESLASSSHTPSSTLSPFAISVLFSQWPFFLFRS